MKTDYGIYYHDKVVPIYNNCVTWLFVYIIIFYSIFIFSLRRLPQFALIFLYQSNFLIFENNENKASYIKVTLYGKIYLLKNSKRYFKSFDGIYIFNTRK